MNLNFNYKRFYTYYKADKSITGFLSFIDNFEF